MDSAGEATGGRTTAAPRFFVPDMALAEGAAGELPTSAAHHATRVLRLGAGDPITLFDGRGGEYAARIAHVDRRDVRVEIDTFHDVERECAARVTLAMSVIATDPMDIAVRKGVEIGAVRIDPLAAARSQGGAHGERASRRIEHWRQIAQSACEQCGRNRVPQVSDVVSLDAWLGTAGPDDAMLSPDATQSLANRATGPALRAIVIGPEGGFTAAELALAQRRGVGVVHIGRRVLRAETAAIAALAIVCAIAGGAT